MQLRAPAVLAVLGLLLLAASPAQGQQQCMLTAQQIRKIDLKPATKPCTSSDQSTLCNDCVCGIAEAVVAAVGEVDASALQGVTPENARAAIMACAGALLPRFAAAGINLSNLMRLQSCPALPPCLAALVD